MLHPNSEPLPSLTATARRRAARPGVLEALGPGLITGAADDDPSGIATYSQAGAQFGFAMLWTMVLTYPLMAAVQMVSARIGRVSGHGLASNLARHYPGWPVWTVVALLCVANTANIAADVAAMGDAAALVLGGRPHLYAIAFGCLSIGLQIFVPYVRYVRILKWLCLVLLAYVATALVVDVPWSRVLGATLAPAIRLDGGYLTTLVAILGTTISPYLFFWQASQEVEEMRAPPRDRPLRVAARGAEDALRRIRIDTLAGMGFSNLVAYFVILAAGAALHGQIASIETAADAARALRPIAGPAAEWLFCIGMIGTGLLAIPVLAGSAAYALAGTFGWRASLAHAPSQAKAFYVVIVASTAAGVLLGFAPIGAMSALYWSAVINGVVAVPVMAAMMRIATRHEVMGRFTPPRPLLALGWIATLLMGAAAVAMVASWFG